jgi:glycosyltransferase involved in cell wall biosynthesis
MKILWFTSTPSKAAAEFGSGYPGGGWIASLESLVTEENIHEIGICFFYDGDDFKKVSKNGVKYYGIPFQKENSMTRILNRQYGKLKDTKSDLIETIIADFKPDLIHVFGTESGYGEILINKFDKVLFHLQGLVAPYAGVYFPNDFGGKKILMKSGLSELLRGITFYHYYIMTKRKAAREIKIIKNWKYFSGRTDWDKNYTFLLNPSAKYFHSEEALRNDFFSTQWSVPDNKNSKKAIVIGTTINPNIYKGLDLIYKVLDLLKDHDITWKVFGSKEDAPLNTMVKKIVKINLDGKASLKFLGSVGASVLIEELKTCHFFVHPSYIDNSPNSVCEAMLLGMPVLSSSVGGVKSLITHNEDGFLFNPYDKYDLAGLLSSLINDYGRALAAAQKARQTAMQRHSPVEIMKVLNGIYTNIYNDKN